MAARIQMGVNDSATLAKGGPEYVPDSQVLDNQARAAALGVTIPGLKSPSIVSSADPILNKNESGAMTQAASGLLTTGSMTPYPQYAFDAMNQSQKDTKNAIKANQLQYRADLAANDLKYAELHNELQQDYQKSVEIGTANAAALNPYSQAQGAMTADNFNAALTSKYHDQARKLQQQADVAQQQLAAGNYKAYNEIMQNASKDMRNFQETMYNWMVNEQKTQADAAKFQYQQGQDAKKNFADALKMDLPSQAALEKMSEAQLLALPAVQAGLEAGYDVNSVVQALYDAADIQGLSRRKSELELQKINIDIAKGNRDLTTQEDKVPTFAKYLETAEQLAGQTFAEEAVTELRKRYDMLYASAKLSTQEDDLTIPERPK